MDDKKNERTPETDNEKSFYQPEDASSPALDEDTGNNSRSATGTKKTMPNSNIGIEWEAAEYVHHPKGVGWIAGLIATALLLVAFAVWLHAWTFVVLIIVMAVAFGIIAFRPPKLLHYKLDGQGITVSGQFYALSS